jgi:hypothetical protein
MKTPWQKNYHLNHSKKDKKRKKSSQDDEYHIGKPPDHITEEAERPHLLHKGVPQPLRSNMILIETADYFVDYEYRDYTSASHTGKESMPDM